MSSGVPPSERKARPSRDGSRIYCWFERCAGTLLEVEYDYAAERESPQAFYWLVRKLQGTAERSGSPWFSRGWRKEDGIYRYRETERADARLQVRRPNESDWWGDPNAETRYEPQFPLVAECPRCGRRSVVDVGVINEARHRHHGGRS